MLPLIVLPLKTPAKRHIYLVNVRMALGQTAGCPRVNRAKKFMCSPRSTGSINFSLWLTGGLSQGCPDFQKVYVFRVYVPVSCPMIRLSQRFLRFAIAMPIADPGNRSDFRNKRKLAMLRCDLRVRWEVASDLRFRAAISEPKTPFFLRDFWRFGSVNAEIASDCDCAILVC